MCKYKFTSSVKIYELQITYLKLNLIQFWSLSANMSRTLNTHLCLQWAHNHVYSSRLNALINFIFLIIYFFCWQNSYVCFRKIHSANRCVRLTTYLHPVPLSRNLGTLTSWNPLGHSRPVTGLLYLYIYFINMKHFQNTEVRYHTRFGRKPWRFSKLNSTMRFHLFM